MLKLIMITVETLKHSSYILFQPHETICAILPLTNYKETQRDDFLTQPNVLYLAGNLGAVLLQELHQRPENI